MFDSSLAFYIISFIPLAILLVNAFTAFQKYQKYFYVLLILLSLIPKIFFLSSKTVMPYDIPGHIDHIKYIAANFKLPKPYDCWECSQQPIYYMTAAYIYKVSQVFGNLPEESLITILQYYSFFLYYIFLFISILIFKLILNRQEALIASNLILFWPSGALHSARIGNDLLLYCLIALSIYFLLKWWRNRINASLVKSIFFTLIGLLTKTSALMMIPVLVATYLMKEKRPKKIFRFLSILILASALTMIINQRNNLFGNKVDNWLVPNWAGIPKGSQIKFKLENFITFDLNAYLTIPNISPGADLGGRQYFWIYLIKTSLFGELPITNLQQQNLSKAISFMMLLLIAYMFIGLISLNKQELRFFAPILLIIPMFISALIVYRIQYPCPCTNEFRFILPIIIPLLVLISLSGRFFFKYFTTKLFYIFTLGFFISLAFLFHIIPSII